MSDPGENHLNLLLFTVGGVRFGCDSGQVAGIADFTGAAAEDLFWLHEELGFQAPVVAYRSPTIVSIRTEGERPYRVIIDTMEEIGAFSLRDIRLFPALLEPLALQKGLWGILPRGEKMVFLVDFQLLLKMRAKQIDDKWRKEIS